MIDSTFLTNRLPAAARVFGVELPRDLAARIDTLIDLKRFPLPTPNVSEIADEIVSTTLDDRKKLEAAYNKALTKLASDETARRLAATIRSSAEIALADAIDARSDEIIDLFNRAPRITEAREQLATYAPKAPVVSADQVLTRSVEEVTAYKIAQSAWATMQDAATRLSALTAFEVVAHSTSGAIARALAISAMPQFDSFRAVGQYVEAAKGARAVAASSMSSGLHVSGLVPALLARAGVETWELRTATQMRADLKRLKTERKQLHWMTEKERDDHERAVVRETLADSGIVLL